MKITNDLPQPADFHIHTTFCDGNNTAEEMVLSAIEKGFSVLGFSGHAPMPFAVDWCMKKEKIAEYRHEIARLQEEYREKICILCGMEKDYYSDEPTEDYDFIIGSVHYVEKNGEYIAIDHAEKLLCEGAEKHYGGDFYAFAKDYYALCADLPNKTGCNIIGHFDVFTKFNENNRHFDTSDLAYRTAWQTAVDSIYAKNPNVLFEINTGAISRRYRTDPYPASEIMRYIAAKGGEAVLTSDSHSTKNIGFAFDKASELARKNGLPLIRDMMLVRKNAMTDKENQTVNLLFGLPTDAAEDEKLLADFFMVKGLHIVCGGSTATRVASYLGKPLTADLPTDEIVPPIGHIEGVTLVTEGILTVRRVLALLRETANRTVPYFNENDGASKILNHLIDAESIVFHVGLSESPQKTALGLSAKEKADLIFAISELLTSMGKTVKTVIHR